MSAWSDAPALRQFLTVTARRLTWISVAEGAAMGFAAALVIALLGKTSTTQTLIAGVVLAAGGIGARVLLARANEQRVAALVERRAPACRNVVLTATEMLAHPERVRAYVGAVVCERATDAVRALQPASLFPANRAVTALGVSSVAWALVAAFNPHAFLAPRVGVTPGGTATISSVDVVVTPPPYAGRRAESFHNPARVDALVGSTIRVTVQANASAVAMETVTGHHALTTSDSRAFSGELVADADGYISIEPTIADQPGVRRLIGLSVTPDQAPHVRLPTPGRDLTFADPKRTIDVALEADDDIGLESVRLRFTKVTGSGERFTFTEGDVALTIARANDRSWKASGTLRLDTLKLSPGDLIVYRAVASDKRPGAVPSESDTYIVEISSPGSVAAAGFATDDARDKYGISQQMVILKTERLIARQKSLVPDSLSYEAQSIAAEQRAVRAEFVFMMGGELAEEVLAAAGLSELNEVAEAEAENDIAAGRLANRGRLDLVRAIRSMSRANTALTATSLAQALTEEKAALTYLQGAFAHARYILRALTQRERLDLSRRLSGELAGVGRDVHPTTESTPDVRTVALRNVLAGIATLAGTAELSAEAAASATSLAERVLRVDPSASSLQDVATQLTNAAQAIGRGQRDDARRLLDRAATGLTLAVRSDLLNAPQSPPSLDAGRLRGALTDALRHPGGVP